MLEIRTHTHDHTCVVTLHLFVFLLNCFFVHSSVHSFNHSINHSFIHSVTHSLIHSLVHSFTQSFLHSFIPAFMIIAPGKVLALAECWMDVPPTGQAWRCLDRINFAFPPSLGVAAAGAACCMGGIHAVFFCGYIMANYWAHKIYQNLACALLNYMNRSIFGRKLCSATSLDFCDVLESL